MLCVSFLVMSPSPLSPLVFGFGMQGTCQPAPCLLMVGACSHMRLRFLRSFKACAFPFFMVNLGKEDKLLLKREGRN